MSYEDMFGWGFKLLTFVVAVILVPIYRAIRNLELDNVKIKGNIEKTDQKVHHIEGNYKQGIEALNHEVGEMKTDIKELLKLAYGRRSGDYQSQGSQNNA